MANGPDPVQLGYDAITMKLYSVSMAALWTYDYLLTVGDEVLYAWKTDNIPMFSLFLFTRYFPVPFLVWVKITSLYPGYTTKMCKKTAFIEAVYYTLISASAQLVLIQRTYAITRKNILITCVLCAFAAAQFVLGLYIIVHAAVDRGVVPVIPLPLYQTCVIDYERFWIIVQSSLFLAFDITVFVLVVMQILLFKPLHRGVNVPSILDVVGRDSAIYFAVMASSHFIVVVLFAVARPGIRGIGIVGLFVFIPVMITRMIISLKKSASKPHMNMETPSAFTLGLQDSECTTRTADGIPLSVLKT